METSILEIDNGLTTTSQLLAQHVGKTGETIDVMVPVELAEGKTVDMPLSLRQDHATALNATPQYQLLAKNVEAQKLQHRMQIGANLPQVAVVRTISRRRALPLTMPRSSCRTTARNSSSA